MQEQAEAVRKLSAEKQEQLQNSKDATSNRYNALMSDLALQGEARKVILNNSQQEITKLINSYASDYEMLGTSLGESLYSGISSKVKDIIAYVDKIAKATDTQTERNTAAAKLENYMAGSSDRQRKAASGGVTGSAVSRIENIINSFAAKLDSISSAAGEYKRQMAVTANAAADRYYSTVRQYNNNGVNTENKNITVNMTVNISESKDKSPMEIRREFEEISYNLAREISSY